MANKAYLVIVGVCVGLGLGILVAVLVFFGIRWYKRRSYSPRSASERSLSAVPIRTNGFDVTIDSSSSHSISLPVNGTNNHVKNSSSWWGHHSNERLTSASGLPRYSYKDIQKATQNFTTILGQGSFGPVYKAIMPTGEVVAIKTLASDSKQGEKEFQTEVVPELLQVALLARLHHRNLVNLVGYCVDKGQHMLIYEFMSNGSLANILYGEDARPLSWEERLDIALDISHGIEYLHEGAVPPVIHRDLKSANILLDQSMRAKVADFGLSKEEKFDGRNSGLKGTFGYIDPVYITTNKFTMKSDVYSFGIIIFELITAIHPHQNLLEYINLAMMSYDGVDEILDKKLVGECNPEEVRKLAKIANKCLHKNPRRRPTMREALQDLLRIKQQRLIRDETMSFAGHDFSQVVYRIEEQQVELSSLTSAREKVIE